MKKNVFLIIAIIFLCNYAYTQTYSPVVIYTPSGIAVNAGLLSTTDLTSTQKNNIKSFWLSCYNNRITYVDEATYKYNCHGYAWNVSQGGTKVWINSPEQKKYWNCGGYAEVSSTIATKVSFGGPCYSTKTNCDGTYYADWCDHSAITTSTPGRLRSKWGSACLFEHAIADCPYTSTDLHYYALITLTGSTPVCSSGTTFTVNNLPSGSTVLWNKSNNLTLLPPSGNTAIFTANSNGSGWVKAILTSSCRNDTLPLYSSIWVGVPVLTVTGDATSDCTYTTHYFTAYADYYANESNYTWDLVPLNGNYLSPYGYHNNSCAITFYNPYSASGYTVRARAQNSCGTSDYGTTSIWIHICLYFSLSPNPASETVTVTKKVSGAPDGISNAAISEDATTIYTIRIIDFYGALHYSATRSGDSFTFPVSSLKDGQYIVQITGGNNTTNLTLIVKH
jgi:hypothetical protein